MLTTMQMPPVQILGSTLYKKQLEELQQLVTQATFLTNDLLGDLIIPFIQTLPFFSIFYCYFPYNATI